MFKLLLNLTYLGFIFLPTCHICIKLVILDENIRRARYFLIARVLSYYVTTYYSNYRH